MGSPKALFDVLNHEVCCGRDGIRIVKVIVRVYSLNFHMNLDLTTCFAVASQMCLRRSPGNREVPLGGGSYYHIHKYAWLTSVVHDVSMICCKRQLPALHT